MQEKPLTPLEIYKVLPQTNCQRCLLPTCLAFAAGVVAGRNKLAGCPFLTEQQIARLSGTLATRSSMEPAQAEFISKQEKKISSLDLARIAPVIGATFHNNILSVRSLGKDFHINTQGKMTSECHVIPWVKVPLLSYITNKTHSDVIGRWISFREIKGGIDWQGLFTSRCEIILKKLADDHPELLGDIVDLFMGVPTDEFDADIALILYPLPHFPLLICYQAPDDDLESELTIFFDECCGINLHIKSIFTLCSGLVQMFDKIATLHI